MNKTNRAEKKGKKKEFFGRKKRFFSSSDDYYLTTMTALGLFLVCEKKLYLLSHNSPLNTVLHDENSHVQFTRFLDDVLCVQFFFENLIKIFLNKIILKVADVTT